MNNVILTTGDIDGIGQEVTFKALQKIGPKKNHQFIVFMNKGSKQLAKYKTNKFNIHSYKSLNEFLTGNKAHKYTDLILIKSTKPPTEWVVQATLAGIQKKISALVTAPLSKVESHTTHGFKGHTDLFRKYIKTPIFMSFIGKHFNVLLLTDHIPLKNVPLALNKSLLANAFAASTQIAQFKPDLPIAVIGLNPHSGENGLLGKEEIKTFQPSIDKFNQNSKFRLSTPLVPDVAFFKSNWNKYSLFISPYHDQGLIAFKMIHEHSDGIQLTLGLPFIRTSVDHGTAKNIYGKGLADERSMLMAIRYAVKLT